MRLGSDRTGAQTALSPGDVIHIHVLDGKIQILRGNKFLHFKGNKTEVCIANAHSLPLENKEAHNIAAILCDVAGIKVFCRVLSKDERTWIYTTHLSW